MRQKLFTKEIDNKLFAQYKYGSDLSKQMVVAKIFNPFNRGQWYIINSDPNDPDYLWAIVDLFEIEAGSVSREDLQTIKVPPFGLNLERDLYFQPINAQELYDRLRQGERFEHGGSIDVIQNDKDESYLTSVNPKPTDAAIKLADGGEVGKDGFDYGEMIEVCKTGWVVYKKDLPLGQTVFCVVKSKNALSSKTDWDVIKEYISKNTNFKWSPTYQSFISYNKINKENIKIICDILGKYYPPMDGAHKFSQKNGQKKIKDWEEFIEVFRQFSVEVKNSLRVRDFLEIFGNKPLQKKYVDSMVSNLKSLNFNFTRAELNNIFDFYKDNNPINNNFLSLYGFYGEGYKEIYESAYKMYIDSNKFARAFNPSLFSGLNDLNTMPYWTNSRNKMANGGEVAKSWTVMYFKEGKNRFGEKIESAFNNTRVQGTLKEAIEAVKEELVGNISYATIKDRAGDVLVAKVKQDGTINIYREGYGFDKMGNGGQVKVEVGDIIKSKKGINGEVYESIGGEIFQIQDKYGNKSTKYYKNSDFNKSEIIKNQMARGGVIKEGNKYGDFSITQYEPLKYNNDGSISGGMIKLVNQENFDEIIVRNDNALRGNEWFLSYGGAKIVDKKPSVVIDKFIAKYNSNVKGYPELLGKFDYYEIKHKDSENNISYSYEKKSIGSPNPFNGKEISKEEYEQATNKMARGGTTKSYTYIPKSDIKRILVDDGDDAERKIIGNDILDGAYVKKEGSIMSFETFSKKLPVLHNIFAGDKDVEYIAKYDQYLDRMSYFKNGRRNSDRVLLPKAYQHYKYYAETGKYAKGGVTKNYEYIPKSKILWIDATVDGKQQKIFRKDILDGAHVKKSVPKSNKRELSERAQGILDSSLESFENKSASSKLASIKMVEDNLAANKKGIDNIGMGLDEDMVAAGEEFLKIVKSKKYEDKPEIELGTFKEARYAKGKVLYIPPPTGSDNWKNRQMRLAEAKGISGKYTNREHGYIMSKSQAEKLKKYILEGYDAEYISGDIIKPEDLYAKGGVTFKDKVKSISNSLKGKKVPSKLKKDYGATYDKKESVLAATRIAGAMKAKMESKKKR